MENTHGTIAAEHFKRNRGRIISGYELADLLGSCGVNALQIARSAVYACRAAGLPVETITAYRLVRKK
jgi:hypothetical protein